MKLTSRAFDEGAPNELLQKSCTEQPGNEVLRRNARALLLDQANGDPKASHAHAHKLDN
jgi:hypothetical protein